MENQKVVESLLKIVILCGKQGIALRGHRDDRTFSSTEEEEEAAENQGNFLELVRFRAETDEVLLRHLQSAPRNSLYTSKTIQNELIEVIGSHIRNSTLKKVKQAKFFSVIADEVVDVANLEQLSICLRFANDDNVHEIFCDFVELERITGRAIADAVMQRLTAWGLSHSDLRGQCYDGSSNMAGVRLGCRSLVQSQCPKASYVHCAAHQLNLAVVSACSIQALRQAESTIGEVARFFKFSAKRQRLLDRALEGKPKKLKDACRTRWIQRIDAYAVFLELLLAIHTTLQAMASPNQFPNLGTDWGWDGETVTKANGFLYQLESSSFLVSIMILFEVLTILRSVTLKLQMEALDVFYAYKEVGRVVSVLKGMRADSENEFRRIFTEATKLGKELHGEEFELRKPRTNRRQTQHSNIPAETAEQYFRISIYDEFLSHVILDLGERFTDSPPPCLGLLHLLPTICIEAANHVIPPELAKSIEFYKEDLPHMSMVPTEYTVWVRQWQQHDAEEVPKKLIDAFRQCDSMAFPNIRVLLHLALTVPITSCQSERSFSQLKLVKTSRRSTMTGSRLSGLALMKMNRADCDLILQESEEMKKLVIAFNQLHPRQMKLPFILSD